MNYLQAKHIIEINVLNITKYSPGEQIGVKEAKALDMAVNQPFQEVFGTELYPDIYAKAGILYINIATKHAFFNANKRTAWIAMDVFFHLNGYKTSFSTEEAIKFTLKVVNFADDFEELKKWTFDYLKNSGNIIKK